MRERTRRLEQVSRTERVVEEISRGVQSILEREEERSERVNMDTYHVSLLGRGLRKGTGRQEDRVDKSRGIETLIDEVFVKVKTTDPLMLVKQVLLNYVEFLWSTCCLIWS